MRGERGVAGRLILNAVEQGTPVKDIYLWVFQPTQHEIGMRMVADFFEMEGWDTYYLGANTPTRSILQTIVD